MSGPKTILPIEDRSPVEYRALLELAVKEIVKHNASASHVTSGEKLDRLRRGAGISS